MALLSFLGSVNFVTFLQLVLFICFHPGGSGTRLLRVRLMGLEPTTAYMYWWKVGYLAGLVSELGGVAWVRGIAVLDWR